MHTTTEPKFLRRTDAAAYLRNKYGFSTAKTLSKLASRGGGPLFRKAGSLVLYTVEDLDAWAQSKLSAPFRSTSEVAAA